MNTYYINSADERTERVARNHRISQAVKTALVGDAYNVMNAAGDYCAISCGKDHKSLYMTYASASGRKVAVRISDHAASVSAIAAMFPKDVYLFFQNFSNEQEIINTLINIANG